MPQHLCVSVLTLVEKETSRVVSSFFQAQGIPEKDFVQPFCSNAYLMDLLAICWIKLYLGFNEHVVEIAIG